MMVYGYGYAVNIVQMLEIRLGHAFHCTRQSRRALQSTLNLEETNNNTIFILLGLYIYYHDRLRLVALITMLSLRMCPGCLTSHELVVVE